MTHRLITRLGTSMVFLMALFFQTSLFANFVCVNPSPLTPGQLSPTDDCMAVITDALFADDGSTCDGPFLIVVRTIPGDTLAVGVNTVMVDLSAYLGDVIEIEATDTDENLTCSSYYLVEDKEAPDLVCEPDTVACSASVLPADIKPIVVDDNCDDGIVPTFDDFPSGPDCTVSAPFIGHITRVYTATDVSMNTSTCSQEIYILRADTTDIEFPPNDTIDCTMTADTTVTGYPSIDGDIIDLDGFCNFNIGWDDLDTAQLCGASLLILREWSVINYCTGLLARDTQQIYILDENPPVITDCPTIDPITVEPGMCNADVIVPLPVVDDDCSSFQITYTITSGGLNYSDEDLPAGIYVVEYEVTDDCHPANPATCAAILAVVDDETPSAVCDEVVIVSLTNNGTAVLAAQEFDDGSSDNCSGFNLTFMVSKEGGPFGPFVEFDCDDLSDTVMVTLQVTEGQAPFLSNTCMNQVVVQDKLFPELECPDDLTIDCEENMDDLEMFGMPTIEDGCGFDLETEEVVNIDQCGTGFITRTFTATDPSGNETTCTQTITVQNQTPFDGTGIVFPDDYTVINGCVTIDDLEPDDLPAGFDVPELPSLDCAMLATNWDDQVFYFDYPACYKIVRTWQVMDMCHFDPTDPSVGMYTAQQIIAVMDSQPPTINFCPPADTFGLDADCGPAVVTLMPVMAAGNCPNEDIIITNDSPYADPSNPGSDASGIYPEGVHVITFTVADGCGNEMYCSTTVTVTDNKKPTPYCTSGTIAELQAMPNVPIMAVVTAEHLNFASYDNCTAPEDLTFQIKRSGPVFPLQSSITFDCADQGENQVEVWVTDEAGNSDFCVTTVIIQDNMDLCNDDDLVAGTIGGVVLTTMGEELPDVHIEIPAMSMDEMTDEVGDYMFDDLEIGNTYDLEPWKNDDPLNGITTFDLLLMTKHVLNTEPLTDPYKIIAADVNASGSITTGDILELRKLVLHIYDEFPNNNSWRFVRAAYNFPNPTDPFTPAFPEHINVPNHDDEDVMDADFIAVKIGDLNGSASVNFTGDLGDRNNGNVDFEIDDREINAGEVFSVPFRLSEIKSLHAIQFTLEFETDLELQGIEKGGLPGVTGDRFETARHPGAEVVTGMWYHTTPVTVSPEDVLFSLRFRANGSGKLSELLRITSNYTEALAYDESGVEQDLNLIFENNSDMAFQLYQNQPNPFKKLTKIGFTMPEAGPAKLTVYDISGSILHTWEQDCEQGFNQVSIQRSELPSGGVLYYQLETENNTATKKMILLQ